jgi:two-component system, LytTR family, sensor kinase
MSSRAYLIGASLFWATFALFTATELFIGMLDHGHSYARLLAAQLVAWQPWALATPLIAYLGRRYPVIPFASRHALLHLALAVLMAFLHVTFYVGVLFWMRPFDAMTPARFSPALYGSLAGRLHSDVVIYLATLGATHAVEFYGRYRARALEAARLESSLAQARLDALSLQLRPHFLFNTLHAVGGLVRQGKNDAAVEMLAGLSDLLRYSLEEGAREVTVARELELVGLYLHIQHVRFADRLTVGIEADDEARGAAVPPLILQPLVENAVTHGIARRPEPGTIRVRATRERDRLQIDVFNTGPGVNGGRRGLGLANTEERLRRMYGDAHRLTIEDVPGGVRARLTLPFRPAAPGAHAP